jgi:hypothetical protein
LKLLLNLPRTFVLINALQVEDEFNTPDLPSSCISTTGRRRELLVHPHDCVAAGALAPSHLCPAAQERITQVDMIDCFLYKNEYRMCKLVETTIRKALRLKTRKIEEMNQVRL